MPLFTIYNKLYLSYMKGKREGAEEMDISKNTDADISYHSYIWSGENKCLLWPGDEEEK